MLGQSLGLGASKSLDDVAKALSGMLDYDPFQLATPLAVTTMPIIELDTASWRSIHDFYHALLASLGAPDWHGRNLNALIDSMIWGGINKLEPPYTVRIREVSTVAPDIREEIGLLKQDLVAARAEFRHRRGHDVEVDLETVP